IHGCEKIYCIVTDSDVNRVWAPANPRLGRITYLAPSMRVRKRLKAYGVSSDRIIMTGYPLPDELVGGLSASTLRANLRRRLVALDRRGVFLKECRDEISHFLGKLPQQTSTPPHLTFAVGGAGAQTELVQQFLPSLAYQLRKGKLKLTLVAGLREEVAQSFRQAITQAQLEEELSSGKVDVLLASSHEQYFRRFNRLLADTDVLWTKPSELSFFGALGIPLILAPPIGSHERYNRRFAVHAGAAVKQMELKHTGQWLSEMFKDGTFAGAAWTGYMRMPKFGLYRIIEEVMGQNELHRALDHSVSSRLNENESSVT
ncbi:MAG: hypothetical protein MK135_04695, partial [Polyangiaceae bacterium]|nr:hypothetical protein [Polyangiaceae bacterium]